MIKIRICSPAETDVNKMEVRGWTVKVTHDNRQERDVVYIIKNDVKFRLIAGWHDTTAVIEKSVGGKFVESKTTTTFHDGIVGTIYVNDHSNPEKCYAYFRTRKIVDLMERLGVYRVLFGEPDSTGMINNYKINDKGGDIELVTDGTVTRTLEGGFNPIFEVMNATYIYNPSDRTLTIASNIDAETLDEIRI